MAILIIKLIWGEGYLLLGGKGSPIWGNGRKDIKKLLRMSTRKEESFFFMFAMICSKFALWVKKA